MENESIHFQQRCAAYQDWLTTPLGRRLMLHERRYINKTLSELFGYQLLQVSVVDQPLFQTSPANYKCLLNTAQKNSVEKSGEIIADIDAWPIASHSVDILLLHHVLDFTTDPHVVLREAARVISPGGYLVCCTFNPWSLWGVTRYVHQQNRIGRARLSDWLRLLEFDVKSTQFMMYQLPSQQLANMGSSRLEKTAQRYNLAVGASYVMVAHKCVRPVTPIPMPWRNKKTSLISIPMAKPTLPYGLSESANK